MDAMIINDYIPNWKRFCDRFHPEQELIQQFETRFMGIEDIAIRENLGKHINVELGIILLRETEIGRETFDAIFSVFFKNGQ